MAIGSILASGIADIAIIGVAVVWGKKAHSRWTQTACRVAIAISVVELFAICLLAIRHIVWPREYPIEVAYALWPVELLFLAIHWPSLLVFGFDEVVERFGVIVPTIGQVVDIVVWSVLVGYIRARLGVQRNDQLGA